MNTESLKTELQQVLENDISLRKEFVGLKRSLSDYRNQLIMRDEDCKRLQVTIDVLNTKLVVVERDNNNYKGELAAFKELRSSINEQLRAKQEEVDARLQEIEALRTELNGISEKYEEKFAELKNASQEELEKVKTEHSSQINELRINSQSSETVLREEFENRINGLSVGWAEKEEALNHKHQEEIVNVKSAYEQEITFLKHAHDAQIQKLNGSQNEVQELWARHETAINQLNANHATEINQLEQAHQNALILAEERHNSEMGNLLSEHSTEVEVLKSQLDEQRQALTTELQIHLETLQQEFSNKEQRMVAAYENEIQDLRNASFSSSEELNASFQNQIAELSASHESIIATLKLEYEAKLSNTLIHSNAQNSKLTDELNRTREVLEAEQEMVRSLNLQLSESDEHQVALKSKALEFETQYHKASEQAESIAAEFEKYKLNFSSSSSEQIADLNNQIAGLNLELENLGILFETTTNNLADAESNIESKSKLVESAEENSRHLSEQVNILQAALSEKEIALEQYKEQVEQDANLVMDERSGILESELQSLREAIAEKEQEMVAMKQEFETALKQQLESQTMEFNKLLAENSNLIHEIDLAMDKLEAGEAEINLLKTDYEESKAQNAARAEELKEVLNAKNFEITALEAGHAALQQEMLQLKAALHVAQEKTEHTAVLNDQLIALQHNFDTLLGEKHELLAEINVLRTTIASLENNIADLNNRLVAVETEADALRNNTASQEQEQFVDRLFKQIDLLNDERLALLNEKEQMASQLLKMNDSISGLSQHIDIQEINVSDLNNHRKNVILASNSGEMNEKSQMKKQINDLAREIDKCIALLSA
jgi:chromosome segregation ATPase